MSQLQLLLFGAPRVQRNGQPVPIRRRKGMALLTYLALTGRTHSREALATLLWPDLDHSRALSNLRRELSRLKQDTGAELFRADRTQLALDPEVGLAVDVQQFRTLLAIVDEHGHFPHMITWLMPVAAILLERAGQAVTATELLALSFHHPQSASGWLKKWPLITSLCSSLAQALGEGGYRQAWDRGRQLNLEAALNSLPLLLQI